MDEVEEAAAGPLAPRGRLARVPAFSSVALGQFRLVLAGTSASQLGTWMEEVARSWLVFQLTNSAFQLGLVAFLRGISTLVFSPAAGVVVDRLDRRRVAAFSQAVPGAVSLAVGLLVGVGWVQIWHLYIMAVVVGANAAVNMPARQVLVYDVVGSEHLPSAIALNSVTGNVSRIVAPSLAGLIIGAAGVAPAFYCQATSYWLAVVATLMLRPLAHVEAVQVPVLGGIREGFDYVRRDEVLSRLVMINVVANVLIYPYVAMMPVFAKDILHSGSAGYGVLLTGVGFGAIPGGLTAASMQGRGSRGKTMALAALLYMGMVLAFSFSRLFGLSFAILIVGGIGWALFVTLNQTLLQLNLDDAFQGRGMALYSMAAGLTPFGNLGMGAAAQGFGVPHTVAGFAATGLMLAALAGIASRKVRRL
jgi:predicted MFS family arabinose efflux permease